MAIEALALPEQTQVERLVATARALKEKFMRLLSERGAQGLVVIFMLLGLWRLELAMFATPFITPLVLIVLLGLLALDYKLYLLETNIEKARAEKKAKREALRAPLQSHPAEYPQPAFAI